MTFGSVCDGIGCGHLGFVQAGLSCDWSFEIEAFPSAVLARRFPDVPNYGDMTACSDMVSQKKIEAPDVFIGGTPCQAFSVAGKRKGLEDARGNLSLTFCEIANAIDDVRRGSGKPPCVILWENVPGVLSDKGNAFGCFLGELSGSGSQLQPAGGKWGNAGCVFGPARTVAWRVLDSQFFGVAQRRRRVFVVASAGDWVHPEEILFEREGVRRDSAPSRDKGKGVAGDAGERATESHGFNFEMFSGECGPVSPALQALRAKDTLCYEAVCMAHDAESKKWPAEVTCTLNASFGDKQGLEDQHALNGASLFVPVCYENHPNDSRITESGDISPATSARAGTGGGNLPLTAFSCKDYGNGAAEDISPTLRAMGGNSSHANGGGQMAVAFEPRFVRTSGGQPSDTGVHPCLRADENTGDGAPCVAIADVIHGDKDCNGKGWNADGSAYTLDTMATQGVCTAFSCKDNGRDATDNLSPTLRSMSGVKPNGGGQVAVCFGGDVTRTLSARHDSSPCVDRGQDVVAVASTVRRLTVTECERLQGLPDGWTKIPWKNKPAADCPDGPRYKGIGNGQTVQVMQWLAKRIKNAIDNKPISVE